MLSIHLLVNRHLNCFHILAIVNIVDVNAEEWVSLHIPHVISFEYTPRIGIAGSCGSSFFFWRTVTIPLIVIPDEHYMKSADQYPTSLLSVSVSLFLFCIYIEFHM